MGNTITIDPKDMYWEMYDDQVTEDYDYIGVMGSNEVEELTDIEAQVAEFKRLYGKRTELIVYRKNKEIEQSEREGAYV